MQFVYPGFLLALSAISIPILIHLFNFKKFKKVYFTNIKFLQNINEETKSKSRLKHLLILLARILFITFLVLAFAQPFIPKGSYNTNSHNKTVSIFIDNSFSMNNVGKYGQLFNVAKQYAYQIVKSNPPSTKYRILSNEISEQSKRLLSREAALSQLAELGESSESRSLEEVFEFQKTATKQDESKVNEFFIASDFQTHKLGLSFLEDTNFQFHLIPLEGNQRNNVSIDSCWFESPVRKHQIAEQLSFTISNRGNENLSSFPVRLSINGVQITMNNVDLPANSTTNHTISYTLAESGLVEGELSIDDYPIKFDNKLFFSYSIPERSNILVVSLNKNPNSFQNLFENDSSFMLTSKTIGEFTFSDLEKKQVVVLNSVSDISTGLQSDLKRWINEGGKLIVFPPSENEKINSINKFMANLNASAYSRLDTNLSRIRKIDLENPLYSDVFEDENMNFTMPEIKKYYPILKGSIPSQTLIYQVNNKAFLVEQELGKGKVFQFSVAEDESFSNFSKHALFVVTLFQIGNFNENNNELYYSMGNSPHFNVDSDSKKEAQMEIEGVGVGVRFIPEIRNRGHQKEIWFHNQIKEAGIYKAWVGESHKHSFAVNYNQEESNIEYYDQDYLERLAEQNNNIYLHTESFENISKSINEINFGKLLWQYMILAALLMLIFEVLLIKFWQE